MSTGGIFGIGTSALQSYQRALQVTGHNIANVGTEGYSRQRLELATREPGYFGFGALGSGVDSRGVVRVADEFVQLRLGMSLSADSYQRTVLEFSRQLDGMLADPQAGLAPALQQFFAAVSDVANDPTSTAARQRLISEGQTLVDRFAQLEGRIEDQRAIANGRIRSTVEEINQLAAGVADLNQEIAASRARMGGRPPNDLLDRRDHLLQQLAERISISTTVQEDGSVNVYAGRGQALVVGGTATSLVAQPLGSDPERLDIGFNNGRAVVVVTDYLNGGRLGALLELRGSLLDQASNALGRIGVAITETFNQVHARNMTLDGQPGGAFFSRGAPQLLGNVGNAATGRPQLTIADVGALEASDYDMRFDGAQWTVRRASDGQVMGTVAPGGSLAFDGLLLDTAGLSGAAAGDRFSMHPMRVAGQLRVGITDPRAVAAALPVAAEPALANQGTVQVASLEIASPDHPDLRAGVQIRFSGGVFEVDGQSIAPDPSGDTRISHNGWEIVLRGTPAEGDVIQVRDNADGRGDNRGALALAALADQRILAGGTATAAGSYSELVAEVGVRTRRAEINAEVQGRLLADARAQRENISGVNLDEEAANLLRFQQAYQAAAQVIATANSMFDTLLAALRR